MDRQHRSTWQPPRPSDEEFWQRVRAVQHQIRAQTLDGVVAVSGYMEREGNVLYLTGHRNVFPPWASDHHRNGIGFAAVWIPPEGSCTLFVSYRADPRALGGTVGEVVETLDLSGAITTVLQKSFGTKGPGAVGIAGSDVLPLLVYQKLTQALPHTQWSRMDDLLVSLRMVKSPYEQSVLQRAAAVADQGLRAAMAAAGPGVTEKAVALAAQRACIEAGADHIVRTRLRSGDELLFSGRWPMATEKIISAGEFVYIDLLGWVDNYAFDVARTWAVGNISGQFQELLDMSVHLLNSTIEALMPGQTGDQVAQSVKDHYAGTPWEQWYFQMGHGVGIECVENPWILPNATVPIQPGMVLSLEPSFTIPHVGKAQQENMVLITQSGPVILTEAGYQKA